MAKKQKAGLPQQPMGTQPMRTATINPFGPTQPRRITRTRVQDSEFILEDGTKIVVRPVIGDVRRAVDQYNESGEPLYFLTIGQTLTTKAPRSLLKSNQGSAKAKKSRAKKAKKK